MVSFWLKKNYLADLLSGSVDIHCHLLPAIDDGAANLKASVYLIEKCSLMGIQNFIATPHIMSNFYPNTKETISNALLTLKEGLTGKQFGDVKIRAAAEYMMDTYFEDLIETEPLLALKDMYVLVEMSYVQSPINLEMILGKMTAAGYIPVLAHPERYAFLHGKKGNYEKLKKDGCKFQLNALSLSGYYGKNIKAAAFKLLEDGFIDYLGTDTHHPTHVRELSKTRLPKKHVDSVKAIIERTKYVFM